MAKVYFSSLDDGDLLEVDFVTPAGKVVSKSLFVDSGFTGQSSFVLSDKDSILIHAHVSSSSAKEALRGAQNRGVVLCQIPGLSFHKSLIAIFAKLSQLSLPSGIDGMAGLNFLRQFAEWGSEKKPVGKWTFFLSD